MIKRIDPQDFSIRPFKAYKLWNLTETSNGIQFYRGVQDTTNYFNSESVTRFNGRPLRSMFDGINQMYYNNVTNFQIVGQKGLYESNIRTIHTFCNVISIPGIYFGEEIKPSTVRITDGATGRIFIDDGLGNLVDFATSSMQIGNVIYPHGMVIGTHTGSLYSESFSSTFDLQFRASTTIYETEIFLEVDEGEFNVSTNPTAYIANTSSIWDGFIRKKGWHTVPGQGEIFYDLNYTSSFNTASFGGFADYDYSSSLDPTGSYLAPYITTIGLYDDNINLVAVAKLAKPIKSLPDFPINFIIRLDI